MIRLMGGGKRAPTSSKFGTSCRYVTAVHVPYILPQIINSSHRREAASADTDKQGRPHVLTWT
jgi:hypothetical protein